MMGLAHHGSLGVKAREQRPCRFDKQGPTPFFINQSRGDYGEKQEKKEIRGKKNFRFI